MSIDELTAGSLAQFFVNLAKRESMRVGHRYGGTQGNGIIPFDTGALQNSIRVTQNGKLSATVKIGSDSVFYAAYLEYMQTLRNGAPNLHAGFIERFAAGQFAYELGRELGVPVRLTVERSRNENSN